MAVTSLLTTAHIKTGNQRALRTLTSVLAALLISFMLIEPGDAASSVVSDPAGDVSPPYIDIVQAKVTEQRGKGEVSLHLELAARVPESPPESTLLWNWAIDTDPATNPGGIVSEFVASASWDGGVFSAVLHDRRPLVNGLPEVTTYLSVRFDGATVKMSLPLEALGSPDSFQWAVRARALAERQVDAVPDDFSLALWSR